MNNDGTDIVIAIWLIVMAMCVAALIILWIKQVEKADNAEVRAYAGHTLERRPVETYIVGGGAYGMGKVDGLKKAREFVTGEDHMAVLIRQAIEREIDKEVLGR